jgi:hypothetical protein
MKYGHKKGSTMTTTWQKLWKRASVTGMPNGQQFSTWYRGKEPLANLPTYNLKKDAH